MNDKIEIQVCEKSSFHLSKVENIFTKDKRIEVKHIPKPKTCSASACRRVVDGFESQPKNMLNNDTYYCYVRSTTTKNQEGECFGPKMGATYYQTQLELPDKLCNQRVGCILDFSSFKIFGPGRFNHIVLIPLILAYLFSCLF